MNTDEPVRSRTWRNLVVAHSIILGKMEADLRSATGLTLGQYDVLLRLHEAPGNSLRMGDLAEQVLVTTSGVTRVADRLAEAGLVERIRPDNDRRVVTISLTPAGKKTLRAASDIHRRGIAEYFADLIEPEELPVLDKFFGRLAAHHTNTGDACDLGVRQLPITPTNR
ncbi:MarR family transcriptional regulator [Rhodococcus sp. SRB_17]|uniref:MarR family winged helix-turn-helix transcriptional regulator n=1 Tax=Rhodococcus sp. ARC_M6 TaxID=2928852 RepID=UPI00146A5DB7|nr:MarR family transcriptional regulator [Rhodococcus sp. ARC_M6]MCJ0901966.1 MarR family transcriptional regulator [Rhodococcus sp. ARC_M6]NMM84448.1 MarR family transcriptional regulator [Rhodococcus sp. SRB_17]